MPARQVWARAPLRSLSPVFGRQTEVRGVLRLFRRTWLGRVCPRLAMRRSLQVWSWAYTLSRQRYCRPTMLQLGRDRPRPSGKASESKQAGAQGEAGDDSGSAGLAVRQGAIELERRLAELAGWGSAGGVAHERRPRRRARHRIGLRPNEAMKLTKLVAAPVRRAEVPPRAFRRFAAARTASQLIPGVRWTPAAW